MTFTENRTETYHVVTCHCAAPFAIPDDLYRAAVVNKARTIHCPSCGQGLCWTGKTAEQKKIEALERKLKWEAEESARQKRGKESAEASLRTTKGVVTKLRKRSAAGVCPCCKRTFKQLAAHMAEKHPNFP